MCLILFAYNVHPEYRLVLGANRDEFYDRPTGSAEFWPDSPQILAGRDLALGGTWLGITRTGRFACVTNYRDMEQPKGTISRGNLVSDFLRGTESVGEYLEEVRANANSYTGFNLIVGEFSEHGDEMGYCSNRGEGKRIIEDGTYGLSNALLDSAWPKVDSGKRELQRIVANNQPLNEDVLLHILQDKNVAPDHELPDTGIGLEKERLLSSKFIESPIYGTRSACVLLVGNDGAITFAEQSYIPELAKKTFRFRIGE